MDLYPVLWQSSGPQESSEELPSMKIYRLAHLAPCPLPGIECGRDVSVILTRPRSSAAEFKELWLGSASLLYKFLSLLRHWWPLCQLEGVDLIVPAPAWVLRISFLSSSNLLLGSVLSSATEVAWDFCKPCSSCSTLFMQPALRPSASYFHIPQFVLRHFTCAHVCSCHPSTLFMLTRS